MSSLHVALLRGINVGGKNLIPMTALRARFEEMGFGDVQTYIASGNVVFSSKKAGAGVVATIEKGLSHAFAYESRVVVVSAKELGRIVEEAPAGFGKDPTRYRYDVIFVRPPAKPKHVLDEADPRPGVDEVHAGSRAVYFRRLVAKASQSRLPKLIQRPIYKEVTIRNWNTTTKLLAIVGG